MRRYVYVSIVCVCLNYVPPPDTLGPTSSRLDPRPYVRVPQLIDRLAQVGVRVAVDRKPNKEIFQFLEKWVTGARTKDEKRIPVGRVPPAALDLEADPRIGAAITPSAGPRTRHIASVAAALLGRSGDMGSATEPAKS